METTKPASTSQWYIVEATDQHGVTKSLSVKGPSMAAVLGGLTARGLTVVSVKSQPVTDHESQAAPIEVAATPVVAPTSSSAQFEPQPRMTSAQSQQDDPSATSPEAGLVRRKRGMGPRQPSLVASQPSVSPSGGSSRKAAITLVIGCGAWPLAAVVSIFDRGSGSAASIIISLLIPIALCYSCLIAFRIVRARGAGLGVAVGGLVTSCISLVAYVAAFSMGVTQAQKDQRDVDNLRSIANTVIASNHDRPDQPTIATLEDLRMWSEGYLVEKETRCSHHGSEGHYLLLQYPKPADMKTDYPLVVMDPGCRTSGGYVAYCDGRVLWMSAPELNELWYDIKSMYANVNPTP